MAKVFLCYRREDSGGYAGRVQDRLVRDLGADVLFMDVDSIPLGKNFVKILNDEVAKCEVLLAVIGRTWIDARDEDGKRRLDNPNDFVRIEIAAALQRDIPVIPILLEGARIPNSDQLPKELEELSVRNAINLHHSSFHSDVDRLVRGLQALLNVHPAPEERAKGAEADIASSTKQTFAAIEVGPSTTDTKRRSQAQETLQVTPAIRDQQSTSVAFKSQNPTVSSTTSKSKFSHLIQALFLDEARGTSPAMLIAAGAIGSLLPVAVTLIFLMFTEVSSAAGVSTAIMVSVFYVFFGGLAGLLHSKLGTLLAAVVSFCLSGLVAYFLFPHLPVPPAPADILTAVSVITSVPAITSFIALVFLSFLRRRRAPSSPPLTP
jgi:hypothetical protein